GARLPTPVPQCKRFSSNKPQWLSKISNYRASATTPHVNSLRSERKMDASPVPQRNCYDCVGRWQPCAAPQHKRSRLKPTRHWWPPKPGLKELTLSKSGLKDDPKDRSPSL